MEIPCTRRVSHTGYLAHGDKQGVGADSRVIIKGVSGKSPKVDLTSAKDLTIELTEGREYPYHRFDQHKAFDG